MESYNPKKEYFGPEGNLLSEIIPKYPPGIPQLRSVFNLAAYNHDTGYEGIRRSGWLRILDIYDRYTIDKEFLKDMLYGIESAYEKDKITYEQYEKAVKYAKISYRAVRGFGWVFFRSGDKPKKNNKPILASTLAVVFASGCVAHNPYIGTKYSAGYDEKIGIYTSIKLFDSDSVSKLVYGIFEEDENQEKEEKN